MKKLLILFVMLMLVIPLTSAQFFVKFQKETFDGVADGETLKIPATLENTGQCILTCSYKMGDSTKKEVAVNLKPQQTSEFNVDFQVHTCGQESCQGFIDFACKENIDGKDCIGKESMLTSSIQLTNIKGGKAPLQNQEKLSVFKASGFRIELFEKTIDGLSIGSKQTTKATIFNEGQSTTLKCSYIIPSTEEEQQITEGLSPGSNSAFNIIFFVPKDCREPCSIAAHVKCYDKQSAILVGETDVSFDLTGIQSTGQKILGFSILALVIAGVIFIIWKVVKFFKNRGGVKEPVEEEGKRQLSAIMFTDMKGYSKEMGHDEESTLKKIWRYEKAMKSIIHEHDGRVVKTIGDAIMGDFNSAVNAVKAAIEIQNLLKKEDIKIRIGIHLGDVIHKGGDIFGDGVNIASRIESICEPGLIYISEDVYSQVKGKIHAGFENLGSRPLKNIESPPRVYKIK